MLIDSPRSEAINENRNILTARLLALLCALAVTGALLAGYFYVRNRHAVRTAASTTPAETVPAGPKGPPKIHVMIDDPMLKAGTTLIGGTVRNISQEDLMNLSVDLELRRRKDAEIELKSVAVEPAKLSPEQEGRYELKLPVQAYASVRIAGFRGADQTLVAYSSSPGQKRPLEKTESKTITVQRQGGRGEEFLNTPDNPARVP
jgi:hypothetical protein